MAKPFLEHLRLLDRAIVEGLDVDKLERVEQNGKIYVIICKEEIDLEPIGVTGELE